VPSAPITTKASNTVTTTEGTRPSPIVLSRATSGASAKASRTASAAGINIGWPK